MRLVSQNILKDFCTRHASARAAAIHWETAMRTSVFANFHELRQTFRSADLVTPFTVFNIGGGNYRLITKINFEQSLVKICGALTHAEYDKWNRQYRKGMVKS